MDHNVIFKEKQQFRQWWLWMIMVFVAADSVWITVTQWKAADAFSFENVVLPGLLLLLPMAVFVFMLIIRLDTEITADGVYVKFFPIHRQFRFYPWSELDKAYVRKYSPLGEYGGWGLRGLGYNKALNISGKEGLQLITKDGYRMLIGTARAEELRNALIAAGLEKL